MWSDASYGGGCIDTSFGGSGSATCGRGGATCGSDGGGGG
jgi:hypothetical protein